ncbi:MAG: hypothetical protein RIS86_1232 [Planctomycetota bacterium]
MTTQPTAAPRGFLRPLAGPVLGALAAVFLAQPSAAGEMDAASRLFGTSLHATASERLAHALDQFANWAAWVELVVGIGLAVALSALLAYHPKPARRRDMAELADERKTLVILGVIGAVVSGLVLIDQSMALVIFGIGGLIRFRTVIGNPHATGRAILVVVVGLACGITQYLTAIVIAGAAWGVIWWLHARRAVVVKVRLPVGCDRQRAQLVAAEALRAMQCRVESQREGASGRSFRIVAQAPSTLDDAMLARSLEATLAPEAGRAEVEVEGA